MPHSNSVMPLVAALALAAAGTGAPLPSLAQQTRTLETPAGTQGWTIYRSPQMGFSLSFPDGLFKLDASVQQANGGGIWLSEDRRARLIATSGPNVARESVAAYREAIIKESYAAARIDYERVLTSGFVLSGILAGVAPGGSPERMFYERVTFVCDGRFIYSWQMMYPVEQRQKFDRIVEAVARSYKPGRGWKGDCSE
jgi:hypothetical protein